MRIALATSRKTELESFIDALGAASGTEILIIPTGEAALEQARADAPDFLIVDEGLPGFTALKLVSELIKVNAMINTVVVSPLSEEEFHEASEGLGVLTPLPMDPDPGDADRLAALFEDFI